MSDPIEIDEQGFARRIDQHLEWLRTHYFSEATAHYRRRQLAHFVSWCADRGLTRPSEVTKLVLDRFQAHLFHYRKKTGEPLSLASQQNHLTAIRGLFRWLARQNYILYNPASEIVLPRLGNRLPKHVLTPAEAERVINVPDTKTPLGIRDRAILETLYSTGMRRMEVAALKLYDVDFDRGVVTIRKGKGGRQRIIPIGARALRWIDKYLEDVRPTLVVPPDEGYVFLTYRGNLFDINSLTEHVRLMVQRAEIGKPGAVHLFRHTCATVMLEGGADVRYVQEMLGHSKLDTTQIYTHVAITKLKEVHTLTHPAEQRQRKRKAGGEATEGLAREEGKPRASART